MNDFLFYLTILALLYYFFYYRPSHQLAPPKLTHSQFTQTDPAPENHPELETKLDHLIQEIQTLCLKIN